jgi:thiol:disulfide interchange protein
VLPQLLLALALLLLAARIAVVAWDRAHPAPTVELVSWQPIAGAEEKSRTRGLPILYDFSADWCGPCLAMQREVFADRASARVIDQLFVPVRVVDRVREEGRNPPEVDALQRRFGVRAFPTLVIVRPDGGAPTVIEGYPGRATLMRRLSEEGVKARVLRGGGGGP